MTEAAHRATHETVVVVAGGAHLDTALVRQVPIGAYVIAADSGVDHALAIGLPVHEAVGDFDSVTAAGLDWAERTGARIERHSVDKDATDLELAFDRAVGRRADSLLLLDGGGGRLDHLLGNVVALTRSDLEPLRPRAIVGCAALAVIHGGQSVQLSGWANQLVSLLAFHGPASGVTTTGLRWALTDAVLAAGSALGVSNRFVGSEATVAVGGGVVVAVQPGLLGDSTNDATAELRS